MDKQTLQTLYCERKLSMMQVAAALGVTHAAVLYWLRRHGIPRRSWSESTYLKLNPLGDPFSIPDELTTGQQKLLLASLMLYWGEGSKSTGNIQIANLDYRVLQVFVKFLREVCGVNEARLKVYVLLHRSLQLSEARQYWASQLKLPLSQVLVYHHRDERSKPKQEWSKYGIATLGFHSTKLKRWLMAVLDSQI